MFVCAVVNSWESLVENGDRLRDRLFLHVCSMSGAKPPCASRPRWICRSDLDPRLDRRLDLERFIGLLHGEVASLKRASDSGCWISSEYAMNMQDKIFPESVAKGSRL